MSEDALRSRERWSAYYQAQKPRPTRELYRLALQRFEQPGMAVDLGCGMGVETEDLLHRGWQVLAVDQQEEAIEKTLARVAAEFRDRLETRVAPFDSVELPVADFIWAGLSLPFCFPEDFPAVWTKIVVALKPGGCFAGDFFGVRHVWANRTGMSSHTVEQVKALCPSLTLEYILEEEGQRQTALEGLQHWHGISIIVRKT